MTARFDQETLDAHKSGCFNGRNAEDCYKYAEYLKANDDWRKALKLFKVNCDAYDHAISCLEYGNTSFNGNKKANITPNMTEALRYFEKGCQLGHSGNCLNSGMLLVSPILNASGIPRDYQKGMGYLEQSCDMNNGNACFYLAGMYAAGIDNVTPLLGLDKKKSAEMKPSDFRLEQNMEKAFAYTEKACELNNWRACFNLSSLYATGTGTGKDLEKSQYYKERCKLLRDRDEYMRLMRSFQHP